MTDEDRRHREYLRLRRRHRGAEKARKEGREYDEEKDPPLAEGGSEDDFHVGHAGANYQFDLGTLVASYGDASEFDMTSPIGLIEYIAAFVNRPQPRIDAAAFRRGEVQAIPQGWPKFRKLLLLATTNIREPDDPYLHCPSDEFLDEIRRAAEDIRWLPELVAEDGGARWQHHAFIESFPALYALVAGLLMDSRIRERFGYCQYKDCEHPFFVVRRDGRMGAPSKYCSSEHTEASNAADNKSRQTRRRAIKALVESYWSRVNAEKVVVDLMAENPGVTASKIIELAKATRSRRNTR